MVAPDEVQPVIKLGASKVQQSCQRFRASCRPLINKPPPFNKGYNRDPNIKALKRREFINHGSTLGCRPGGLRVNVKKSGQWSH